jgi:hypothetical protein
VAAQVARGLSGFILMLSIGAETAPKNPGRDRLEARETNDFRAETSVCARRIFPARGGFGRNGCLGGIVGVGSTGAGTLRS